jgi:perosamine synthetase
MTATRLEIACRELAPTDVDDLATMLERSRGGAGMHYFDPFPMSEESARRLAVEPRLDRYYVAIADDRIVALSMLRGWDEGYSVPSFGIMVDPEWHGRSVGSALTDYTLAAAERLGCGEVRLSVYASNGRAVEMYRRRGFVESSRETVSKPWGDDLRVVMVRRTPSSGPSAGDAAAASVPAMIPAAEPALVGREREYVLECLDSSWISSNGSFIGRFEAAIADYCEVGHAVACANGTAALHVALLALGIGPGDEVVCPTLTYVAAANAIRYCGATPVLVDADPETWTMSTDAVAEALTDATRAVMVVHLYGHPADVGAIRDLTASRGIVLVEDAAEALGATYRGRPAGGLGDVATFSFYGNKTITTGEGGVVVTDDGDLARLVRQLRGQGQDFERRYWFPVVGFNYRMTNVAAAIGLGQMENVAWHVERRRVNAAAYRAAFADDPRVVFSPCAEWADSSYWMSSVLLRGASREHRDEVMERLLAAGIETRPFFVPMHVLPPYADDAEGRFPVADELSARGLNLPSSALLRAHEIDRVADTLVRVLDDVLG